MKMIELILFLFWISFAIYHQVRGEEIKAIYAMTWVILMAIFIFKI